MSVRQRNIPLINPAENRALIPRRFTVVGLTLLVDKQSRFGVLSVGDEFYELLLDGFGQSKLQQSP